MEMKLKRKAQWNPMERLLFLAIEMKKEGKKNLFWKGGNIAKNLNFVSTKSLRG